MAYLNYNQQNKQQDQGMNSLQSQQQPQTTGAAPLVSSGQITPSAPQQTQQQQARQSQKGSGQFVNLRGYIQQNQPKAQEISGAIGQNINQQAQQIGQQVQKQQQDLTARIAENQGRIAEQQQFGQQQLQKALAVENTTQPALAADELSRFRNIVTGNEQFGTVQGLNTAGAQQQLGELQRYTQNIQQAPTRNELLRSTFSKMGTYGAGQRGLDDMLLAASQPAMQSLTSGAQATQQQYKSQLQQAQEQAAADQAALAKAQQEATSGIQKQLETEQTGIKTAVDTEAQRAQDEVKALFDRIKSGQITQADADALGLKKGQILMNTLTSPDRQKAIQDMSSMAQAGLRALTPNEAEARQLIGGLDYDEYMKRIGTSAEDIITEKQLAQSRALAQLAGQTDPYLNAQVGRYASTKQTILDELKNKQAQANLAFQHALRNASAYQIAPEVLGATNIDNWDLRYTPYVEYYTDPTGQMQARLSKGGEGDPRFNSRVAATNEAIQQRMDATRNALLQRMNAQVMGNIAEDGGIMQSKYSRWGRLRGKIK